MLIWKSVVGRGTVVFCFLTQHKTATLSVLQRKKGIAGLSSNNKEAFKTIGLVSLPLHVLADGKVHEMDLTLGWCKSQTAYMEVVVSSAITDKVSCLAYNGSDIYFPPARVLTLLLLLRRFLSPSIGSEMDFRTG